MATVQQLLDQKGYDVWSVHPDDSVFNAIKKMADKNIGSLAVMEDEALVGIITERSYARNVILKGRASPNTPVRDIMTKPVPCLQPEQSLEECIAFMVEKRVRHLPVRDDGKIIGMISMGDLLRTLIGDQKFVIDQLEKYIHRT